MKTASQSGIYDVRYRMRLLFFTGIAIFLAEVLVMLVVEGWASHLSMVVRVFLDASLLMVCVFPTLYFLVFQEMNEQIERRQHSEQLMAELARTLEAQVEERTVRLQRANEDLLNEVRERARISMALNQSFKDAHTERSNLEGVINALAIGLLVVDAGGTIRMVNAAGEALLGTEAHALVGRPLAELLAPALPAEGVAEFLAHGDMGGVLSFPWARGGSVATALEMQFGGPSLWQGEPATVIELRGGGE